jgi:hypothetical protein
VCTSLTFQVSRTAADYDALRRQASREIAGRPLYKLFARATILAGGVVAFTILYLTKASPGWGLTGAEVILLFLVFFGAWSLFNWLAAPLIAPRFRPALEVFRAPLTVSLSDDGVRLESAMMTQMVRWAAIGGIRETASYIFFLIDGAPAVVIPRRAFADAGQQAEFLRLASAHQRQSLS